MTESPTGLTDTHRAILDSIRVYVEANGYAPTMHELMALADVSSTSVVTYRNRPYGKTRERRRA